MTKAITREDWLNQVAQQMRPLFTAAGAELPERFRVTMSLTRRSRAIGVCYDRSASAFVQAVTPILEEVGPFPHAPLDWGGQRSGPKKQTARLLKVECKGCGLVVRQTRKWIDEVGPAHCPAHGEMVVERGD